VDQIEVHSGCGLSNIHKPKFDIAEPKTHSLEACQIKFFLVDVSSDNSAGSAHFAGHVEGQITSAAADLEAGHPGSNAGATQQGEAGGLHHTG
jgi:hypothetical protein